MKNQELFYKTKNYYPDLVFNICDTYKNGKPIEKSVKGVPVKECDNLEELLDRCEEHIGAIQWHLRPYGIIVSGMTFADSLQSSLRLMPIKIDSLIAALPLDMAVEDILKTFSRTME